MNRMIKFLKDYFVRFLVYGFIGWLYEVLWYIIVKNKFVNRGVLLGPVLPIYGFGMIILLLLLSKYKSKKHTLSDLLNGNIAVFTICSFLYITIIEYTSSTKIYRIDEFGKKYGIGFLVAIIVSLLLRYIVVKKLKNSKIANLEITPIVIFLLIFVITTIIEYISHYVIDVYFNNILWDYSKDFLNLNARVNFDASRNFAIGGTFLMYLVEPFIMRLTNSKSKIVNYSVVASACVLIIDIIYTVLH